MIYGIGNDVIEIERVRKACDKPNFLSKYYTEKERAFFSEFPQSLAGNFAAKEAVAKAFGTGFRDFGPKDIEVLRDGFGKPYVVLYNEAEKLCNRLGIQIIVSISHSKQYATAVAIAEIKEK